MNTLKNSLACACLIAHFLTATSSYANTKPNVIVILSDDQGWADIGYNNPNVYSPNLDKLANTGAKFTHHYVMPQCTPTRVAAMTGRYPGRFGNAALQATNVPVFPIGTPTLATMFKAAGYETYLSGKWHLGAQPDHGPNNFGFDSSYGSFAGAVGMYDHRYREGEFANTWHRDHELIPGYENGIHATDLVTNEAIRIIEKDRNKPFFLYLAYHAVHTPVDERGRFVDEPTKLDPNNPQRWAHEDEIPWFNDPAGKIQQESDPEKRLLLAAVHHLDDAIGKVVDALDRTNQRNNTLILFSSDNGPQGSWPGNAYPSDLKLTDFNQPLPMRGLKTDVWEGGIRVPGFVNWPSTITPKEVSDHVHIVDWFPTLAKLIDYKSDTKIPWDGLDISKTFLDGQPLPPRELYIIWGTKPRRWSLRFQDWKLIHYGRDEPNQPQSWQLYNLQTDPKEKTNVADQHPEVTKSLHARFENQRGKDQKKNHK